MADLRPQHATAAAAPAPLYQTPHPHGPLRRVRSTLLVASYRMVQKLGREADYLRALPPEFHPAIVGTVAGTWVPVDAAVAHYVACESLGLSSEAQLEVGRAVGAQIRGTLFGTIVNLSKQVGATPWTVFAALPRFWPRVFDGSVVTLSQHGPKDALLELKWFPLADVRYFRNAFRGQVLGMLDLFCTRAFASSCDRMAAPGDHALRIQWA